MSIELSLYLGGRGSGWKGLLRHWWEKAGSLGCLWYWNDTYKKSIVDGIINSPYINKNGILKNMKFPDVRKKEKREVPGVTAEAHNGPESQMCANGRKGESTEDPDMEERLLGTDGGRTWESFQS